MKADLTLKFSFVEKKKRYTLKIGAEDHMAVPDGRPEDRFACKRGQKTSCSCSDIVSIITLGSISEDVSKEEESFLNNSNNGSSSCQSRANPCMY